MIVKASISWDSLVDLVQALTSFDYCTLTFLLVLLNQPSCVIYFTESMSIDATIHNIITQQNAQSAKVKAVHSQSSDHQKAAILAQYADVSDGDGEHPLITNFDADNEWFGC